MSISEIEIFKRKALKYCYDCTKFTSTFPSCECDDKDRYEFDESRYK